MNQYWLRKPVLTSLKNKTKELLSVSEREFFFDVLKSTSNLQPFFFSIYIYTERGYASKLLPTISIAQKR